MPFGPCPRHSCFKIVEGLGMAARRRCKGMHASGFGRSGGRWNMLRRGESSWLCMKLECAFFAGHSIFIKYGSSAVFSCIACE